MYTEAGSLLLFESGGAFYERLIVRATGGQFVHAAVSYGPSHMLEATRAGITLSRRPAQVGAVIELALFTDPSELAAGMAWAYAQVGRRYGWVDIAYQALKFVAPNNPLRFGVVGEWDCSDFATRVMQHAGIVLPDEFNDPYANTPNDLARLFGLLGPRRKDHPTPVLLPREDTADVIRSERTQEEDL